ncbi:hypothetical protein [Streptomyces sp. NBC_01236]|uniref:hypothetical protein n=1 Tax=Streptomyces sp. NBC_01236 TaxID=2903789 RepID=UPI002E13AB5C|nr:hypothetical protein OG324_40570 [Streptomyces sp. NBC_01236]
MTAYVLPLLATAAAAALTYVFCVRPMRRGNSCHMSAPAASDTSTETDAEIRRLREEVQLLRHEADLIRRPTVPLDKEDPR